jgi:hypothetical protein
MRTTIGDQLAPTITLVGEGGHTSCGTLYKHPHDSSFTNNTQGWLYFTWLHSLQPCSHAFMTTFVTRQAIEYGLSSRLLVAVQSSRSHGDLPSASLTLQLPLRLGILVCAIHALACWEQPYWYYMDMGMQSGWRLLPGVVYTALSFTLGLCPVVCSFAVEYNISLERVLAV